jgi:quinol monooxygenase YgiN
VIIIAGTVDVDPEKRDAALHAGVPHVEGARSQKGCLAYVWSADSLTPGRIYVFERWASEEDLKAHFAGPHYSAMLATMNNFGLRGADVLKYRPAISEPVYDDTGTPRADFFTEKK